MADFSGGPGLLAFVATFALVAGLILLLRSFTRHLRKVRVNPPVEHTTTSSEVADAGKSAEADATGNARGTDGRTSTNRTDNANGTRSPGK